MNLNEKSPNVKNQTNQPKKKKVIPQKITTKTK